MEKRKLIKFLLLLPASIWATTQTPFLLKRSQERRHIKERWMNIKKSFHYFDYDDRDDMGYGVLRVLDDAKLAKLTGTPVHPHKNMEILTILLSGRIFHQDSLGHSGLIKEGEIQLMSAGSGLKHAETNPSQFEHAQVLQIWISPKVRDSTPYYQQRPVSTELLKDRFFPLVSSTGEEGSLIINQDAFIYRGRFTKEQSILMKPRFTTNGFYIFVIQGRVTIGSTTLFARDALGINHSTSLELLCHQDSDILLFEIPMHGAF